MIHIFIHLINSCSFLDTSFVTDCISFLIMNSLNIQLALTFDQHFIQAGYQKLPT